ncbi:MAG: hypothetical protein ACFFC3_08380, partial [Candidatus Odinarchaeota archaeon]
IVGMDSVDEILEMAELSDLEVYIIDSALNNAGLTKEDLVEYECLKIITIDDLVDLIENTDVCLRY